MILHIVQQLERFKPQTLVSRLVGFPFNTITTESNYKQYVPGIYCRFHY